MTVNARQKRSAGPSTWRAPAALLDVGERDARDGRQVAGHERQHAGGDERDEADARRRRRWWRRPTRRRSQVVALHVDVERGPSAPEAGRAARGRRRWRRQRIDGEGDPAGGEQRCRGRGPRRRARPRSRRRPASPGRASTLSPNSATSARLTSSFELAARRSAARCRRARAGPAAPRWRGRAACRRPGTSPRPRCRRAWSAGSRRRAAAAGRATAASERDAVRAPPHVRSYSSGSTCSRMKRSSTGPRCTAAMRPRRSITKVSG